jgi:predicted AlkP superfamily pyrophosphatase or phosphodiesterase
MAAKNTAGLSRGFCYSGRVRVRQQLLLAFGLLASFSIAAPVRRPKPKLVVAIIIDQFRYDYLTRFGSEYHGGIDQLLTKGADFTSAFYGQVPTVTAVGHSIFMSGAMPAVSGIIGNSWYDRESHQFVTSVCDWSVKTVGGRQAEKKAACTDDDPASPARLLVTTLGDELKLVHPGSKVIGVSRKARASILPSGHAANAAFWFDDTTGNFVSSTFYMEELPPWAAKFNERKLPAKYVDQPWPQFANWKFRAAAGAATYSKLEASPWSNELIEAFAEQAITGERLGQRGETDLLTISFSANDSVGHAVGPYAPEVKDMAIRTDQLMGKLFALLEQKVGMQNVVVVLSADHGVAATPKQNSALKIPGGYLTGGVERVVTSALNERFGNQNWLIPGGEAVLYFDRDAIKSAKATPDAVYETAREAIIGNPQLHVARVYTRSQLENGEGVGDFIAQAEVNGFFPRRSGDLQLVFDPGFIPGKSGTTHFSPYNYDRRVPVIFMGPGIKGGRYDQPIRPNDIAPTLANLLDIQTPSGSSGRVLSEILVAPVSKQHTR